SGITRSTVPTNAQEGIVFHAGAPDGSVNWAAAAGRCTAASTAAVSGSTPLAKHSVKPGYGGFASQRRYRSAPPSNGTGLSALSSIHEPPPAASAPSVSPSSGMNA